MSLFLSRYEIMKQCWLQDPNYRPDFTSIGDTLQELLEENAKQVRDFYDSVNLFMSYFVLFQIYLNKLKSYKQNGKTGICDYVRMSSTDCTPDTYVIMNGEDSVENKAEKFVKNRESVRYSEIKNGRPVAGNGPIPKNPMEVVPMIQI